MPERRRKRVDRLFIAAVAALLLAFAGYALFGPRPFAPPESPLSVKAVQDRSN